MQRRRATYRLLCATLCACTCLVAGLSRADSGDNLGGSIAVTTDYVYRGISQSLGNAALQADLHYQSAGGWVLGVWASRADVDADETAALEIDAYLSRQWMLSTDWDVRLTLTHYTYPDDPRRIGYKYDELVTSLGYQSRLFATVAWSPNASAYANETPATEQTAVSYEFAAVQPLFRLFSMSAGVGYYDLPSALHADYWFWNIGLACSLGRTQINVAYIDTDRNAQEAFGYERTGGRWAGSLAWRF